MKKLFAEFVSNLSDNQLYRLRLLATERQLTRVWKTCWAECLNRLP